MGKHTPGPWEANGLDIYGNDFMPVGDRTLNPDKSIAMGGRFKLASLFRKGVEGHFDEVWANARLIAAAPELLEALERIGNDPDSGKWGAIAAAAVIASRSKAVGK